MGKTKRHGNLLLIFYPDAGLMMNPLRTSATNTKILKRRQNDAGEEDPQQHPLTAEQQQTLGEDSKSQWTLLQNPLMLTKMAKTTRQAKLYRCPNKKQQDGVAIGQERQQENCNRRQTTKPSGTAKGQQATGMDVDVPD